LFSVKRGHRDTQPRGGGGGIALPVPMAPIVKETRHAYARQGCGTFFRRGFQGVV
jgi:hypothetical protein